MKKQKQHPSAPAEPISSTSNELLFLVYSNGKDAALISKNIAGPLNNLRNDCGLVIVSSPQSASDLSEQKEISDLIAKQKCRIATPDESSLADAFDTLKSSWVYIIDNARSFNASVVSASFQANKKLLITKGIYTGTFNRQSGKAPNFLTRIKKRGYNFLAQLVLPLPLKDYTHQYTFFHREVVSRYLSTACNDQLSLLCKSAYEEVTFNTYPLTQKENTPTFNRMGSIIKTAVTSRFNWFIGELFSKRPSYASSGNKPVTRFAFLLVFMAALLLMPMLSKDYGISWDARRHNTYGYEMLKYFDTDGQDKTALSETSSTNEFRYYGEHFNVIAAWLNTYVKAWGEFETRHLLNSLYGLIAMLFAALAAKEIGSWRSGLLAFVFIFFSPVFFGHSMNNPTDIPFAAGCSMALYYLIKVLRNLPSPKFTYLLWCGVGIGIAIGARIGGIVFYAYTGLFMGLSWLTYTRQNGLSKSTSLLIPYFFTGATIVVIAHLVGISLWPFGQEEPLTNWYVALKKSTSAEFFTYNHELFEGTRMYMANVPWYYLPKFIIINSPLFVLAGFVALLVLCFTWKKKFQHSWIFIPMVLFIFLFPIIYAEVKSMYYYNGWRHYLFTYPPLIVLTALGWESLFRLSNQRFVQIGLTLITLGFVALPAIWMVKNHPNEVVYYNELVGGTKGAYGNYEMDYYSNSCREAAEWIAAREPSGKVVVAINNEPLTGSYFAHKINPDMEFQWVREYEEERPFWDYAIYTSRTYSKNELLNGAFPPKGTVYEVKADGIPLAVVVKREVYYMPLGYKAFDASQFDSALYYFTSAAEWNTMDEEAFRMKGMALLALQRPDEAITAINRSIQIYPENYIAYMNLGLVYFNGKKDPDKALECFKKSSSYKYNYTDAYYYSAICEYQRGNYGAGIKYLENSLKRGGSSVPEIYYNLGLGYYHTASYAKAEENLKMSLTINPKNAMGYRLLAEVFTKENKTQEAQFCMQKYQELGGQ